MYKRNKGYKYEIIAQKYLLNKGYSILSTNFSCKLGEIDIIAKKDAYIVFIEVKGRKNTYFGCPCEYVTKSKQQKIILTSKYYLILNPKLLDFELRFDVIEIYCDIKKINHIENAFYNIS